MLFRSNEEDMVKITYISHSCFAVELEHSVLVFDYYQGELPLWDLEKTIYVFASHRHYDHFSKEIFRWTEQYPKIQYILSDDISEASYDASEICRSDLTRIAPNQTETIGNCVIETFRSTDEGVAFLVSCEGKLFYHAGDLNWWHWEEEDDAYNRMMRGDYQKEIETLAGEKIDLAFVVLDPRQEEQFYWGFDWYMRHTDTKIVFPMHMWKQYEVQDRLIGMEVSEPYREKIMRVREKGQVFEL